MRAVKLVALVLPLVLVTSTDALATHGKDRPRSTRIRQHDRHGRNAGRQLRRGTGGVSPRTWWTLAGIGTALVAGVWWFGPTPQGTQAPVTAPEAPTVLLPPGRPAPTSPAPASPATPAAPAPTAQETAWPYDRGDFRIVVLSDFNGEYGSTEYDPEVDRAVELALQLKPDLVLSGGDMVAGQSTDLAGDTFRAMWQAFDRRVTSRLLGAGLPFAFTIGNHDGSAYPGYERERNHAAEYWKSQLPRLGIKLHDAGNFPFHYSFTLSKGNQTLFGLVWDASTAQIPEDELAWVERVLSSPEARQASLRLAIGHLPLYPVAYERETPGNYLDQAPRLRELLERHRVHTYFSGHHHAYFPGQKGSLELLNAGVLGGGPRILLGTDQRSPKTLTVADYFTSAGQMAYRTWNMHTEQPLIQTELPRIVGNIFRQDLEPRDLTPEERAQVDTP